MSDSKELLTRLGSGERIDTLCSRNGWTREQFMAWWREECRKRVPPASGKVTVRGPRGKVSIRRDRWGVPHIEAANDTDLMFGFGFATAQDRLFQLDWVRRRARGQLAEVIGPEGVEADVFYRTLNLAGVAEKEWQALPTETRSLLSAYCEGVNALIEASEPRWPIEFDLLDYRPSPWLPTDTLVLAGEFRWYLTGRFYVIAIPELVRQTLGEGPLYQAFLQGEEDGESIVPRGSYEPFKTSQTHLGVGDTISDRDEGHGSNNWVLRGSRTSTGQPLVASDPHVPFGAVSIWYEVHLRGGSFHAAGIAYAGVPGVMIGRNERMAWGVTNNICSQRDLYREKTDPAHPGCFLYDGQWEPAHERHEIIRVRGASDLTRVVRSSRNGPLVEDVLPGPARGKGPVSLRWLGFEPCGWLTALLGLTRAKTVQEFREATRPWRVPTFNVVYADADGHIGHQCVGRIPQRRVAERGYRPGWDPEHQWTGVIPFDANPHQHDPAHGFIVTANNRLAPDDYPYPLFGTWSSGHRARRIREELEHAPQLSAKDSRNLQLDVRSGRAVAALAPFIEHLTGDPDPRVSQALTFLRGWDARMTPDSVAASLFSAFFVRWMRTVVAERLPPDQVEFISQSAGGLALQLLSSDESGWFHRTPRREAVRQTFVTALDELTARLGADMNTWRWERLHTLVQRHFLSMRGDLGTLLDRNGCPAPGDATTVCSTSSDANHAAFMGASYRMVADLADTHHGLWAIHIPGSSGHPGSPHYDDQVTPWSEGGFHYLPMSDTPSGQDPILMLVPKE